MLQASGSGAKFLLQSSSQTYSNHIKNKLVSELNHAPNMPNVLFGMMHVQWIQWLHHDFESM